MTIEEVINKLKEDKKSLDEHDGYYGTSEHLDIAIEVLEKQIPVMPIMREWCASKCPSCGEELSEHLGDGCYDDNINIKVCKCGQKIKWE